MGGWYEGKDGGQETWPNRGAFVGVSELGSDLIG